MCCWQDEIHLLADIFSKSFVERAAAKFFLELWKIFKNLLKLWMFVMKRTEIAHVMQLAGKNISAIFLGVKNTFQFTRGRQLCYGKQAPSVLVNFKLIVKCFQKFHFECS